MGRAIIERDGDAVIYRLPRSIAIIIASAAGILFSVGLSAFLLRSDGTDAKLWSWLFPVCVTLGFLPTIINALLPQKVRLDSKSMEVVRWFGRRRIEWSEAVEAIGYTNGQDLFLRVRTSSGRILLSTRWSGWDGEEMVSIARHVDALLDQHPNVHRPGPIEKFPSWFSKESGLSGVR